MNRENAKNRPEANKESEPLKPQTLDPKTVGGVAPSADQAIDMGLSVKWAPWNVGASKAEECGAYFAWGEVNASKESYDCDTYFYFEGIGNDDEVRFKYDGSVENEILESSDDAATANWGSGWRMPTIAEWRELVDDNNCTWTWIENYNDFGINGYEVKSKRTDGVLFLPAAGFRIESDLCDAGECGKYWSSVLHRGCACACCLFFVSNCNHLDNDFRGDGFSVRAVAVSTE
ncbi:MAG: hypothetical protein ACI35U_04025 [Marinilabiliaceae bacterium]